MDNVDNLVYKSILSEKRYLWIKKRYPQVLMWTMWIRWISQKSNIVFVQFDRLTIIFVLCHLFLWREEAMRGIWGEFVNGKLIFYEQTGKT